MIVFHNPGLIDLRGIRTFGLSAKVNENPHGFFGTGLKHALAILLRTGHKVTLYRGLDRHVFSTVPVDLRGKGFDMVTLDGTELPFGTELGKTWEVWQAYRELHSNALDECGNTYQRPDSLPYEPKAGETAFVVEGAGIESAYANRHLTFLDTKPLFETETVVVHSGQSNHVYYRGIRVGDLRRPSLFTYNLKTLLCGLTEDRTLKSPSDLDYYVAQMAGVCTDEAYLKAVMLAPQGTFEQELSYGYSTVPAEAFQRTYLDLRQTGHLIKLTTFATETYRKAQKTLPLPPPITLNRIQQMQLDRAIAFCRKVGWEVDEYPIVVVPHAHGNLLALAENGQIILTARVFDMGVCSLVSTLYEEWLHLKTGLRDESRDLQNHLFNQVVNLAQQVVGEAL